jgi:hypothetical protein
MTDGSDVDDELWDDLFHGCAFAAFVELALEHRTWPTPEAARRLAYQHYESALAAKHSAVPEEVARARASD